MKSLKKKSLLVIPFVLLTFGFMSTYGCTQHQTQTAKNVFSKISFYTNLARSLVAVAETQYKDNEKVATALAATKEALTALEALVAAIDAGVSYDEDALVLKLSTLVVAVFVLMNAIKDAAAASKKTT